MEQIPRRKEIWIANVPYSDMSGSKVRPYMIMSRKNYNEKKSDVVGLSITTHIEKDYAIKLTSADFEKGALMHESAVSYDNLIKIDKSLLRKRIARVTEEFRKKVVKSIIGFIE